MRKKSSQLEIRRAFLDLYKSQFILLIGSYKLIDEWAKKAMLKDKYEFIKKDFNEDTDSQLQGRTWDLGGGASLIWMPKWETNVFVHEITHAALNLFDAKVTPINEDTSEPFCYLMEYLFRELSKKP